MVAAEGGRHPLWRGLDAPPHLCFMDGCAVAVQVQDLGLPKSAVGTIGQTSKQKHNVTIDLEAVQVEDLAYVPNSVPHHGFALAPVSKSKD